MGFQLDLEVFSFWVVLTFCLGGKEIFSDKDLEGRIVGTCPKGKVLEIVRVWVPLFGQMRGKATNV